MWFCRMVEAGHTEAPAKLLEVAIEHRLERHVGTDSFLKVFFKQDRNYTHPFIKYNLYKHESIFD
jgi:hypothetical protein